MLPQELLDEHGPRQLLTLQLLLHLLHQPCQGRVGDLFRTPPLLGAGEGGRELQRALGAFGIHQNPPLHGILHLLPGMGDGVATPRCDKANAPNQIIAGLAKIEEMTEHGNGG